MANGFLKLRSEGMKELLQSEEIAQVCAAHAESTRAAAEAQSGGEYGSREFKTDRVGYSVFPADKIARQDNLDNNTLIKSVT